jgi:hypothetical protein
MSVSKGTVYGVVTGKDTLLTPACATPTGSNRHRTHPPGRCFPAAGELVTERLREVADLALHRIGPTTAALTEALHSNGFVDRTVHKGQNTAIVPANHHSSTPLQAIRGHHGVVDRRADCAAVDR